MASPFSDRPANGQDDHHPGNHEQERMLASQKCYETVGGQFIAEHPKLDNFMRQHPQFTDIYNVLGVECSRPKGEGAVTSLDLHVPYDPAMADPYK